MYYQISYNHTNHRFIQLSFIIERIQQKEIFIQLPAWRPGRYELQNFAKNIRNFQINDMQGNPVPFEKTTKDRWKVQTDNLQSLVVTYEYFANQCDAGGSYLCDEFLYINPVNCMMYVEGRMNETYTLKFNLPDDYILATQMDIIDKHTCQAANFDYLADSPLIASNSLEHHVMNLNDTDTHYNLHIWFQGKHPFDINRLLDDTKKYAQFQVKTMGEMPCKDYHFLYMMLDFPFRHGVEHLDSTVIAMGKSADQTTEEFYNDLLAISSHELFHLWNIKRIRPAEMLPYDYTQENYSTLGYVYEGVTTYLGDLFLYHSQVWSWEQYASSLASDLQRHYTNSGRMHYSLAESSWDTWLDGYVQGVPGRKISIYIEGLIAAWVADVMIKESSQHKFTICHVMHALYHDFYKNGKGYTTHDYRQLLERFSGVSFEKYFQELINGRGCFQKWIDFVAIHNDIFISFDSQTNLLTLNKK